MLGMIEIDPKIEAEKLHILAGAQEELVSRHLRLKPINETPTAGVTSAEYGFAPIIGVPIDVVSERPTREPQDWRRIASTVIGLERDAPFLDIARAITDSAVRWDAYLQEKFAFDNATMASLKQARRSAYRVGTLTEDNLPDYKADINGELTPYAADEDLRIMQRSLGLWVAEEDGHLESMDMYGQILDLIGDEQYWASRTSQLRAGSSVALKGITSVKAYTAVQELMTQIAHQLDAHLHEPVGHELLSAIAGDEARHHDWFRRELKLLSEYFPDDVVLAIAEALRPEGFMPGSKGIPKFKAESIAIAQANLLTADHFLEAATRTIRYLGIMTQDYIERLQTMKQR